METIDNALSTVFKNRYSSTLITLFLVLYSGLVAPKLPNFIVKLFENPIFRILILSLIVYNGNKDPQFAIMIAVGFTVTMNMVSKQKLFEGFSGGTATDSDDGDATPDSGGDATRDSGGDATPDSDGGATDSIDPNMLTPQVTVDDTIKSPDMNTLPEDGADDAMNTGSNTDSVVEPDTNIP